MSTFTPGPWLVAKISPYEEDPASPPFCQILAGELDSGYSFEVHGILPEADARLIASAPELYETLETFVDIRDQFPESGKLINKKLGGLEPVQVTVTKDQFLAAVHALRKARGDQ